MYTMYAPLLLVQVYVQLTRHSLFQWLRMVLCLRPPLKVFLHTHVHTTSSGWGIEAHITTTGIGIFVYKNPNFVGSSCGDHLQQKADEYMCFKANICLCWHSIHIWWQSVHHVQYSVCIRWVWEYVLTFLRGEFQFSYLFSQRLITSFKFIWFHDSGHLPWVFSELWWKMRNGSSGEACSIRKETVRELVMLCRHEKKELSGGGLEGTCVWMMGREALKKAKQPWHYIFVSLYTFTTRQYSCSGTDSEAVEQTMYGGIGYLINIP